MKIFITGGSGQLGRAVRQALVGHDVRALNREAYSLRRGRAAFDGEPWPDIMIHGAALTNTAQCEREPELAFQVNAKLAGNVASWASSGGVDLLHVSTNEVFAGSSEGPLPEDAPIGPVNVYGASKLLGEKLVVEASRAQSASIVRTAWLYGDGVENFVAKVLSAARDGRPLRFVTDEIATPTSADDLAAAIRRLIEHPDATPGVYHLTNEGEASRYEWAREIVRLAGLDESRVEPITTADLRASGYGGPRKPPYAVLANTRARALGITLRPWREALAAHVERARVAADG